MRSRLLTASVGLVLAAACSDSTYGGGSGGGCTPTATKICMANTLFSPTTLTITVPTTVTWQNADGLPHTTTSNPSNPTGCPTWNNSVGAGQTSPGVTFATAGATCQYYCSVHATASTGAMRASIVVQ